MQNITIRCHLLVQNGHARASSALLTHISGPKWLPLDLTPTSHPTPTGEIRPLPKSKFSESTECLSLILPNFCSKWCQNVGGFSLRFWNPDPSHTHTHENSRSHTSHTEGRRHPYVGKVVAESLSAWCGRVSIKFRKRTCKNKSDFSTSNTSSAKVSFARALGDACLLPCGRRMNENCPFVTLRLTPFKRPHGFRLHSMHKHAFAKQCPRMLSICSSAHLENMYEQAHIVSKNKNSVLIGVSHITLVRRRFSVFLLFRRSYESTRSCTRAKKQACMWNNNGCLLTWTSCPEGFPFFWGGGCKTRKFVV